MIIHVSSYIKNTTVIKSADVLLRWHYEEHYANQKKNQIDIIQIN